MKVAIMQPYFLPYIGYWQLMSSVDTFIIYDNIQYTKKGWFNRNNILMNGKSLMFTIPLKKDSDYLDVRERYLSENSLNIKRKILNQIKNAYLKAPYFNDIHEKIEWCFKAWNNNGHRNLFDFIYDSVNIIINHLNIKPKIIISSTVDIDHSLRSQDKVIALCKAVDGNHYINMINGADLYSKKDFDDNGLELSFLKQNIIEYKQFNNDFVPYLSIIDIMMFNDKKNIIEMLGKYTLH